jgi:hypothetical protein
MCFLFIDMIIQYTDPTWFILLLAKAVTHYLILFFIISEFYFSFQFSAFIKILFIFLFR